MGTTLTAMLWLGDRVARLTSGTPVRSGSGSGTGNSANYRGSHHLNWEPVSGFEPLTCRYKKPGLLHHMR